MSSDRLFTAPAADSSFTFDAAVTAVFDDMVSRSVPFYAEQQRLAVELAARLWRPGWGVADLGCSTGSMLRRFAVELPAAPLLGLDNSEPMIARARANLDAAGVGKRVTLQRADFETELDQLRLEGVGIAVLAWTLQFVRPIARQALLDRLSEKLRPGGFVLLLEKVLTEDPALNAPFIAGYYAHKERAGYSEPEIVRKRIALENVLVPFRASENVAMLRRAGFRTVEPFFQWLNFVGLLAVKGRDG